MRITVLAIGRLKRGGGEVDLAARYRDRFNASGRQVGLGPLEAFEFAESRLPEAGARREEEAGRLLDKCGEGGFRIALDERGKPMPSAQFAEMIGRARDDGVAQAAFLIGGPDGHGAGVLDAAHMRLSLGPMTLPHGLARVVLFEQLYRAVTILSGHPYHRA